MHAWAGEFGDILAPTRVPASLVCRAVLGHAWARIKEDEAQVDPEVGVNALCVVPARRDVHAEPRE